MDTFINEESLCNQYLTINEFLEKSEPLFKCLNYIIKKQKNNIKIYKHSDLFKKEIVKGMKFSELRLLPYNDQITRMKSILLSITDNPPYWDLQDEEIKQDFNMKYLLQSKDVGGTSIAEAVERGAILLNFFNDIYNDKLLQIKKGKEIKKVQSSYSLKYFLKQLLYNKIITMDQFVQVAYEGTRLDFSEFETKYGFSNFEVDEIQECIETFDNFVNHIVWGDIYIDRALCYKAYQPNNEKNNWFSDIKYKNLNIEKFRCGKNPKRCFGYRKEGKFFVLRMDRTHDVSDNG